MENSSTNVYIIDENSWGHSTSGFVYIFVFQVISEKVLWKNTLKKYFYMKIILTRNSRNQKQETGFQQVGNLARNICFFVIASRNFTSRLLTLSMWRWGASNFRKPPWKIHTKEFVHSIFADLVTTILL